MLVGGDSAPGPIQASLHHRSIVSGVAPGYLFVPSEPAPHLATATYDGTAAAETTAEKDRQLTGRLLSWHLHLEESTGEPLYMNSRQLYRRYVSLIPRTHATLNADNADQPTTNHTTATETLSTPPTKTPCLALLCLALLCVSGGGGSVAQAAVVAERHGRALSLGDLLPTRATATGGGTSMLRRVRHSYVVDAAVGRAAQAMAEIEQAMVESSSADAKHDDDGSTVGLETLWSTAQRMGSMARPEEAAVAYESAISLLDSGTSSRMVADGARPAELRCDISTGDSSRSKARVCDDPMLSGDVAIASQAAVSEARALLLTTWRRQG
jgi:hypothetical protein